ncbi:MAG: alpha-1,4-glucan--maltose-1-phosphate maltosyltransferase [Actinomycetota bacterium]|nr:alpha-1,4-glucan--maltose-1-phosphate maltosyltransferase [Actinomycetota bacterium]
MIGRIAITDVRPTVECGRWPAKAVVGETVAVTATVFREGHDAVAASVDVRRPDGSRAPFLRMLRRPVEEGGTDGWQAEVRLDVAGTWTFAVEGWSDPVGTWRHDAEIKIPLGQDVDLVCEEGARLFEAAGKGLPTAARPTARAVVKTLRNAGLDPEQRVAPALDPDFVRLVDEHPLRELVTASDRRTIEVTRQRALHSAWYEFFPRSEGAKVGPKPKSGTFKTAAKRLPAIAAMGFDVVYLPPVHPIGTAFRKGANNTLEPGPGDPGSPWAIGAGEGGHDAIHPDLGTLADFDAFVARTRKLGMEVALDLALQASPDHPWASEHPEWFTVRADGSIAYAENPPKKYQDIYPVNFDRDPEGIYAEVLRIVRHWMAHDVRIFRVDNPHTKPLAFWERLIAEVKASDPDVLFLAEAFTRPPMMHMLGRIGFDQSYTYFTWRTAKWEIEEYLTELAGEAADYMRPNFFVNTPDILHASLQYGGPPYFKVRAVLAALLSPSWGVYSGFELYEHVAVRPGSEEYLDSEKYAYRPRDWAAAEAEGRTLTPYLTMLNRLRREHPALHWLRNLHFHHADQPEVLAFSKRLPAPPGADPGDIGDVLLVVVNLDPHGVREATVTLDMAALGVPDGAGLAVTDAVTGAAYDWAQHNYVRLDPFVEPAHVFTVRRAGA